MSETLEQLADRVWNQGLPSVRNTPTQVYEFAKRLVEELGKQEAFVVTEYMTSPDNGVWLAGADKAHLFPYGTKLYAAPVIPAYKEEEK